MEGANTSEAFDFCERLISKLNVSERWFIPVATGGLERPPLEVCEWLTLERY